MEIAGLEATTQSYPAKDKTGNLIGIGRAGAAMHLLLVTPRVQTSLAAIVERKKMMSFGS
jgi:hypothetical protein